MTMTINLIRRTILLLAGMGFLACAVHAQTATSTPSREPHAWQAALPRLTAEAYFTFGDDAPHITRFDGVQIQGLHQVKGFVDVFFVSGSRARGFVVNDDGRAFFKRIFCQARQVIIGVGGLEIKNILFPFAKPVFPTNIPTFHQNTFKSVFRGKVDVLAGIGSSGPMFAMPRCTLRT